MSVQTLDQRLSELLRLRAAVASEIRRTRVAISATTLGRDRTPKGQQPPCGTERGYQWHRRHDEPKDRACLDAHADYELIRKEREAS